MRRFPKGFIFGCSTSAYQVEGGIHNDWAAWENRGAGPLTIPRCGLATDHWNCFEEDFQRLTSLGATAYRLSIEWARLEPTPGHSDSKVLDRYDAMIDALARQAIEPFVTLLHFTHPDWFHTLCPWHQRNGDGPKRFGEFVARVAKRIGDRVRFWTVLNEPVVWLAGAYLAGIMPPGRRNLLELSHAFIGLVNAHQAAHHVLKETSSGTAQVGIAHNIVRFAPARRLHPQDIVAARVLADFYNHAFPRALAKHQQKDRSQRGTLDFLGVNYYSRVHVKANVFPSSKQWVETFYEDRGPYGVTDLGWEIHPQGLSDLLVDMSRYELPIYVTENGLDDRDDTRRSAFLYDHLACVLDAIDQGADVRGYFHWSLLDNYEWLEGFLPRFGLFRVDYDTLARTETKAAQVFRTITQSHALPVERPAAVRKAGRSVTPVAGLSETWAPLDFGATRSDGI